MPVLRQGKKRKPVPLSKQPDNALWSDLEQFGPGFLSSIEAAVGRPLPKTFANNEDAADDPLLGWGDQFRQVYIAFQLQSQAHESLPAAGDMKSELLHLAKSCNDLLSRLGQSTRRGPIVLIPDELDAQLARGIEALGRADTYWLDPKPMPEALASIEAMILEFRGKANNASNKEVGSSGYLRALLCDLLHQICIVASEATPFQTVEYVVPLVDRLGGAAKLAASKKMLRPANPEIELVRRLAGLFHAITGTIPPTRRVKGGGPWSRFLDVFETHTGVTISEDYRRGGSKKFRENGWPDLRNRLHPPGEGKLAS